MKLRKLKGYKYDLVELERYYVNLPGHLRNKYLSLKCGVLTMYKHYAWDGPSGPTIDTKTFMRGSLIHDALYQLMREGLLDRKWRKNADTLLKLICIQDGMSKFRAWYVYHSVRLFAKGSSFPRKNPRGRIIEI